MSMLNIGLQLNQSLNQNLTYATFAVWGQHILNMFFGWSLSVNDLKIDLKICMTLKRSISWKYIVEMFSWTCVGGCKSIWKVCSCVTAASNCKTSPKIKIDWFQDMWVNLNKNIASLLDEGNMLSIRSKNIT